MTSEDFFELRARVEAREDVSAEFHRLRELARETIRDGDDVGPWIDCFVLALQHNDLLPSLEASKALVDVALAADETMPVVCPYDAEIKRALSPTERSDLFSYIANRIGDNRSPQSYCAAAELADYLIDIGEGAVH